MLQSLKNIYHLGVKEIRGLFRDWLMVGLIVYSFTYAIVVASRAQPDSLNKAAIAIVDDDQSQLTKRLADAFIPPMFLPPKFITQSEIDPGMDHGEFTFVVVFPVSFQRDVMSGKEPEIQVNVDATRMSQAFTGSGYIQQILQQEISRFMRKDQNSMYAKYVIRNRFNPNLTQLWFTSVMQLVNNITMLAIILTGSALIRERENGTLEHLLVMPVTAFEIMASKIWSMMLIVLTASAFSLIFVIRIFMEVPVEGSVMLFLLGVAL
ncbi:MAG: ABC transporter permease, partial [Lentisphaeria bacterium]|nr:ABC transporter permease [Lentisphaeria bacterium]